MNPSGQFSATKPDEVLMTLTMTMTIGEWKGLRDHQEKTYPGWKFASIINRMVIKAQANFTETEEL